MYNLLDLFSGIGGFSLGLERSGGFKTVAFCEIEPFPRAVLAKHWPEVPCYDDVRTLTAERLAADGIAVDAICGGFPCQDISTAGRGAGIADGTRSGLWSEIARLTGELLPRVVILENVAALLGRGLDRVLGDLAALGYDAEWHCIPASAIGAMHQRDRVWIIAYSNQDASEQRKALAFDAAPVQPNVGHGESWSMAYPVCIGQQGPGQSIHALRSTPRINRQTVDAFASSGREFWSVEPDVGRVANGVPNRSHRLAALGNAVVPQVVEMIGRAIVAADDART